MPLFAAVVLVQLMPPTEVGNYGERLITACTQGLRQGVCVLSGGSAVEQRSGLVAEVRSESSVLRVVDIRLRRSGAQQWVSGKVVFDEDDALAERWTSIGFAIATLAGDLPEVWPPAAPAARASDAAPFAPTRAGIASDVPGGEQPAAAGESEIRWQTAAGGLVGQALREQDFRAGGWASLRYRLPGLAFGPRVHAGLSSAEGAGVSVQWTTLAAGLELRLPLGSAGLHALAGFEGGAALITASGSRSARRVSGLLASFLGVELGLGRPWGAVLGGELSASPATDLQTGDSAIVKDRRLKGAIFGGVSLEL